MIFAERLRSCVMVGPPLEFDIVQDCFQLGFRLATQPFPALAHVCAHRVTRLAVAANARHPEALRNRILRFHTEDAALIISDASRADDAATAGDDDPRELLTAYRTLLEAVVRPWLRLAVDVYALSKGAQGADLPATANVSTALEAAERLGPHDPLFVLLTAPMDPSLRNCPAIT